MLRACHRAIGEQAEHWNALMILVKTELGMHAAAAKSHLGWNVVGFMEADPDLIKEVHGMDIEDLRGHEKRLMQHNRCRSLSFSVESSSADFFVCWKLECGSSSRSGNVECEFYHVFGVVNVGHMFRDLAAATRGKARAYDLGQGQEGRCQERVS